MAPEVARGEEPTERSDLYAAGVLLYFLIEGRPPFRASQPLAGLKKQIEVPAPPLAAPVTPALAKVVARALAKDPRERFPDATSFREALLASLETAPGTRAIAQAETRPLTPGSPEPKPSPPAPVKRRRTWLLVMALMLVLAAVASHGAPPAAPRGAMVRVTFRGGDRLEGELVKLDLEGDALLVRVAGGEERRLPLADIESYEKVPAH
jgi:hypothetical protein